MTAGFVAFKPIQGHEDMLRGFTVIPYLEDLHFPNSEEEEEDYEDHYYSNTINTYHPAEPESPRGAQSKTHSHCVKGDMTQKMFCFYAMPLSFLCPILTENLFNEHPFHSYSNNTVLISGLT